VGGEGGAVEDDAVAGAADGMQWLTEWVFYSTYKREQAGPWALHALQGTRKGHAAADCV
jgi:hypothetical protein